VEPFLYNKGRGRYIPISQLVKLRNCDRPRHKQLPDIRILENPEEDFDIDRDCPDVIFFDFLILKWLNFYLQVSEADYLINPSAYREIVWDLKVERKNFNFHF
jgi:hypothetical protein